MNRKVKLTIRRELNELGSDASMSILCFYAALSLWVAIPFIHGFAQSILILPAILVTIVAITLGVRSFAKFLRGIQDRPLQFITPTESDT